MVIKCYQVQNLRSVNIDENNVSHILHCWTIHTVPWYAKYNDIIDQSTDGKITQRKRFPPDNENSEQNLLFFSAFFPILFSVRKKPFNLQSNSKHASESASNSDSIASSTSSKCLLNAFNLVCTTFKFEILKRELNRMTISLGFVQQVNN